MTCGDYPKETNKRYDDILNRCKELEEKMAKLYPPPYYYPPSYPCSPCYHDCFNCPYKRYPSNPYVTWTYNDTACTNTAGNQH